LNVALDVTSPESFCKEEIDWNADAVVKDQAAIAVYVNSQGEIVIHQRDTLGAENIIWVDPVHAEAVADAILSAASIEARKEPMTDAERAKRYRKRHGSVTEHHGERDASVTELRVVKASS
jgi:hypothetical protein